MQHLQQMKKDLEDEIASKDFDFARPIRKDAIEQLAKVERGIAIYNGAYAVLKFIDTTKAKAKALPPEIKKLLINSACIGVMVIVGMNIYSTKVNQVVVYQYPQAALPISKQVASAPIIISVEQEKAYQAAIRIQQPLAKNKANSPQLQETLDLLSAAGIQINQNLTNTSKDLGLQK